MKKTAIFLILAVLIVSGVILYGLFNANLQVIGKDLQVYGANELPDWFEKDKTAVERNALIGTRIRQGEVGNAEDYQYHVYTLRVQNKGLVDAEMVEVQIAPTAGDVLYYGENGKVDIKAGETRDIFCVLLCDKGSHAVRNIYLTYYLWGHPNEVKFTYDNTK